MKTFIVLCLYDAMLNGEEVSRATFCAQHNISERTFYNMLKASADPKNDLPDDTVQLKFNFDWE